ncbi:hypothetical protein HWV62_28501 [Athelia sp. TMB]|nr:hypothetical protein HWV62_28501 [Athelia sp. TMB]
MPSDETRYIVFGYGSLIHNVSHLDDRAATDKLNPQIQPGDELHYITKTPGYLKGYVRRFAQRSEDHRGTPESPGRVVTLIRKKDWDDLSGPQISDGQAHADGVEPIGGYTAETVDIYGIVNGKEEVIIPKATVSTHRVISADDLAHCCQAYIGKTHHAREIAENKNLGTEGFNKFFMGPEPLDVRADIIARSVGPSGKNKDYLYRLAEEIRTLAPEARDWYLDELEAEVRKRDPESLGALH